MTDSTQYVKCVLCGNEIRDDHDAELTENSHDLVHSDCLTEKSPEEQGALSDY